MKKLLLVCLMLNGCASSSPTYAPDGSQAFSLNCSGTARNWGMCYEKAGEICKERGYIVVAGGTDQNGQFAATSQGAYASTSNTRNIVIKCK